MRYRTFGRLGWEISEVGYGMWGIAGWTGGFSGWDYDAAPRCLERALELGCNFFDTACAYGERHQRAACSGELLREHRDRRIYVATKIAAEEPRVAAAPRRHARRRLPARLHPRVGPTRAWRTWACRAST